MVELEQKVIDSIKLLLSQNQKIKKLILFGSRAKGCAKNGSDIDLAIVGESINFRDLCAISSDLDELDLPYKIDLINYNSISNIDLKEHIDRVGVEL
ncbi:MAG: nucleotidyltransferase domain-containing protein [Epsilonproteobacteria bacterium]|nr:nucleotidyltransferase domain-containing protein [Campylobacterota bacterium]